MSISKTGLLFEAVKSICSSSRAENFKVLAGSPRARIVRIATYFNLHFVETVFCKHEIVNFRSEGKRV